MEGWASSAFGGPTETGPGRCGSPSVPGAAEADEAAAFSAAAFSASVPVAYVYSNFLRKSFFLTFGNFLANLRGPFSAAAAAAVDR